MVAHRHMWRQEQNICDVNNKKLSFRAPESSHLWRQDSFRLHIPAYIVYLNTAPARARLIAISSLSRTEIYVIATY